MSEDTLQRRRHSHGALSTAVMMVVWIVLALLAVQTLLLVTGGTLWALHLSESLFAHPLEVALLPGGSLPTALFYSPLGAAGRTAFQLAHVVVIPLSFLAIHRVAVVRRLPAPRLASLLAFASPALFCGAVASVPGADAALVVALALYALDVRGSRPWGAFLLATLGLIRPELTVLSVGVALARRDRTLALIASSLPVLHAALGVALSGLPWLTAHLTTAALDGPPLAGGWARATSEAMSALVSVCPAIGLLTLVDLRGTTRLERADAAVALAFAAAVIGLGVADAGGVGLGPERLVPALPLTIPILTRALSQLLRGGESTMGVVVLSAVAGAALLSPDTSEWRPGPVVAAWAAVVGIARLWRRAAAPVLIVVIVVGLTLAPSSRLMTEDQAPGAIAAMRFIESAEDLPRDPRIVTDVPLVRTLADASSSLRPAEVSFVWLGRASRPLEIGGELPESVLPLLRDHPFGEALFDPAPGSFDANVVAVVASEALWSVYDDAPQMSLSLTGPVRVYRRAPLSAGRPTRSGSSP